MCFLTADRGPRGLAAGISAPRHGESGGKAHLDIAFAPDSDGRTYIARQYASYPFHICRAQYLDESLPGLATVYVQTSSGGIYAGDDLSLRIEAQSGAAAHVTTQASTVVHSMERGEAVQAAFIEVGAEGFMEYLPDPTILFPRSRLASRVEVRMGEKASVIVGDAFLTHDPAGGSATFTSYTSELRVSDQGGRVLAIDRYVVDGSELFEKVPGVLGRFSQHGSLMALTQRDDLEGLIRSLRDSLKSQPDVYAGVSSLPNDQGAWVRILAKDGVDLRRAMLTVWVAARGELKGAPPTIRRK